MELSDIVKELEEQKKKGKLSANEDAEAKLLDQDQPKETPSEAVPAQFTPITTPTIPASVTTLPVDQSVEGLKRTIHNMFVNKIKPEEINRLPEDRRRSEIRMALEQLIDAQTHQPLNFVQRKELIENLLDDILGFGPLEKILRDPTIGDILVNGAKQVYVERRGVLEPSDIHFRDDAQLLEIIQRIVARVGRRVNESSPMVDARMPDGSRFNAIIPPLSLVGPMVSIRRFGVRPLRIPDLIALKAITPEMVQYLEGAVRGKLNILVSGGTGSGKTTLLNALSSFIPPDERLITIEDAAELQLQQVHVGRLEARPANVEGKGEVSIRDLVRNALRMRPNRIIVGECRGPEALDMLQAMNTGHEGSMTTLHANSPRDALIRLEMMIMMSGLDLPLKAMRQQIASSINLIIQVDRLLGGLRKVTSISEIVGMEQETVVMQELFVFKQTGLDVHGRAVGQFETTGVNTHFDLKIRSAGTHLPPEMFRKRAIMVC